MKMEMSYRDKIILIVLFIILILVGGFFALIRPKYKELKVSKEALEVVRTEWEGIEKKFEQIPIIQKAITKNYEEAKKEAKVFENTAFVSANESWTHEKSSYEIDEYLQSAIDECELKVESFTLDEVDSEEMSYYFIEPDVVTHSLLEAADVNGNHAEKVAKIMKENTVLNERQVAEVMVQNLQLTVNCKRENLMKFLAKIDEDNNAVLVTTVNIENYQFDESESPSAGGAGDEAAVIQKVEPNTGTSRVIINISFYSAVPIDEPDLGEIA